MIRALIFVLLSALILVAYAPVRDAGFVNFDDNNYVSANPHVARGLSVDGLKWAFTTGHASNWHPVTWIAHMIDAELYGTGPESAGRHHVANVLTHALATILLAWLGFALTGRWWASVLVAALFGLHPAHVESVAWISERKDTLSAVLGFATLLAWCGFVRHGGRGRYAVTTVLLALGLMAKPILVTWPLVMLLLEVWPLRRKAPWRQRIVEKLPWFGLVLASGIATIAAQSAGAAVRSTTAVPMGARIVNAIHSTVAYLEELVAPRDFSVLYPHWATTRGLEGPTAAQTALGTLILLGITGAAVGFWRRRANALPLVAWALWLLLLAPVIGILQVGDQAMADRYTYLPSIAVFMVFAGALSDLSGARPGLRRPAIGLSLLLLTGCGIGTWHRAGVWKDSETLFRDAIAYEAANPNAHNNLGHALAAQGRSEEAARHYAESIRLSPGDPTTHFNLGNARRDGGELAAAVQAYQSALAIDPAYAAVYSNLGDVYARQGDFEAAIGAFRSALRLDPALKAAQINLARALLLTGDAAGAVEAARGAVAMDPQNGSYRETLMQAEAALRKAGTSP